MDLGQINPPQYVIAAGLIIESWMARRAALQNLYIGIRYFAARLIKKTQDKFSQILG